MKFNYVGLLMYIWTFVTVASIQIAIHNSQMKEIEVERSKVLVDQITDMGNQILDLRSRKTYEEGLKDGIENSQDRAYISGYHAATEQITKKEN